MSKTVCALDAGKIKDLLPEKDKGIDISVYQSIDSTNSEARRLFKKGGDSLLICAEMQTCGRGRHGKSFYSPEKTGIYMSVAVQCDLPLICAARATTAAAVAVCEAIEELTDKKPQIKWVNDIFVGGKKVCGILTESVLSDKNDITDGLIIGIGVNISTVDFPNEIKDIAGSLETKTLDRNALIACICKYLLEYMRNLDSNEHIEKYRARCFVLGRIITYEENGKKISATALDIDKNGGLVVKTQSDEILTLQSGEISIKI